MADDRLSNLKPFANRVISHTKQLRDIRVLGLNLFIVIALLVTWNSVGVIQANYELQQDLSRLEQENEIRKLENETLRLKNEYYLTDQYLELAARKQFSKAAPGETLVLVPDEVAMRYSYDVPQESEDVVTAPDKPRYQQNFEAWLEFFFRRNANT